MWKEMFEDGGEGNGGRGSGRGRTEVWSRRMLKLPVTWTFRGVVRGDGVPEVMCEASCL